MNRVEYKKYYNELKTQYFRLKKEILEFETQIDKFSVTIRECLEKLPIYNFEKERFDEFSLEHFAKIDESLDNIDKELKLLFKAVERKLKAIEKAITD